MEKKLLFFHLNLLDRHGFVVLLMAEDEWYFLKLYF